MRLPSDNFERIFALSLISLLAACGGGPDNGNGLASASALPVNSERPGPEADYPIVLGDPFTVDGKLYTPKDTLNHDEIGYAAVDPAGGAGVTGAHKTLPLPSYVEVTSLDTGKTALVRLERRGPMTASRAISLSPGAQAQLGIVADGAPVRVRRVNPPEDDRAKLRIGEAASARMETPKSLLAVLRRKLPEKGSVNLSMPRQASATAQGSPTPAPHRAAASNVSSAKPNAGPVPVAVAPSQVSRDFDKAFQGQRRSNRGYPLPSLSGSAAGSTSTARPVSQRPAPEVARRNAAPIATPRPVPTTQPVQPARSAPAAAPAGAKAEFVIQAASFFNESNARRTAKSVGGFVEKAGRYYRVRLGPFTSRGQAKAALAKLRAAGYRDARVFTTG